MRHWCVLHSGLRRRSEMQSRDWWSKIKEEREHPMNGHRPWNGSICIDCCKDAFVSQVVPFECELHRRVPTQEHVQVLTG
mmetsp:Transcript_144442/g.366671  ORF Transcript_144442/g.366671 Transcript_144442/m.366671 type:complete len:80 (+) Transcript_144442:371-610(+)